MFTRKQAWALWLASLGLVAVPVPVLARGGGAGGAGAAGTGGAASAGGSGSAHPSPMEHVSSEKTTPRAQVPIMASAGSDASPATQPTEKVSVDNFSFEPKALTVPVGTRVTWTNHDDVPHTVTSTDHAFSSKAIDTDGQFSYVFTKAGTYTYFCALHPHMKATVVVK